MEINYKQKLIEDGFVVITNFISVERAKFLFNAYKNTKEIKNFTDFQVPDSSYSIMNFREFLELLCEKNMEVAKLIGEMVFPTYSYARIYKNGNVLHKHLDRPSCEISITVHLYGDKDWPIYMEKPNKEEVGINLNPGDAVIYLGCDTPHWRNAYEGEEYGQVFLHYVLSNGQHWKEYFDLNGSMEKIFKSSFLKNNISLSV